MGKIDDMNARIDDLERSLDSLIHQAMHVGQVRPAAVDAGVVCAAKTQLLAGAVNPYSDQLLLCCDRRIPRRASDAAPPSLTGRMHADGRPFCVHSLA